MAYDPFNYCNGACDLPDIEEPETDEELPEGYIDISGEIIYDECETIRDEDYIQHFDPA